jgi:hypothetical protein
MAKKTKRATTSRTTIVSMTPSAPTRTEFNPDYTYVKRDLARIATLAGFFVAVLVVLSFFLR